MAGTANAVNGPEAAPYLAKAGGTMTGSLVLNGAPSTSLQAATKGYVDNVALNTLTACVCGSTAALTVTYDNGASGVGATLTNAGAMAAFSVDGISPSVNDRVLIKNQASGLQNGIYTVTTVGSGAVNWVLTRATDYDEAAEMQAGDKVAIVQGTTQAATEWMMTQTAAITVGVTSLTWAEMGQVTAAVTSVVSQVFTANGTYTPTTGMIYCIVEIVGGGGGGGGSQGGANPQAAAGAGGGGGGYTRMIYTAAEIGANAAVTIGAGGTGGAAGNNNGSTGGTSDFNPAGTGATIQATGGVLGVGAASIATNNTTDGRAGGVGSGGNLNINGGPSSSSIAFGTLAVSFGGTGGNSYFGGGGVAVGNSNGSAGTNYGGGGAGGSSATVDRAGGAGADGVCVVTEFVSTSA